MAHEEGIDQKRLRRRAEVLLEKRSTAGGASAEKDAQLIQELQIHQIELEMQNEELRRIQKELESQRDRYSYLFNHAPVGYMTIDDAGIVLEANHTLADMLKVPLDAFHRKPFADFIDPGDRHVFISRFRKFYHSQKNKTLETRLIREREGSFPAILEIRPAHAESPRNLRDSNGKGLLVSVNDISPLKETQELLRRERDFNSAVLHTVDALVVVLDPAGKVISWNRRCEEISGYCLEELRDSPFWDRLVPAVDRPEVKRNFKGVSENSAPVRFTYNWLTKSGEKRLIEWSSTAIQRPDGGLEYVVETGIDVTEREEAEKEKDRLAHQLMQASKMEAIANLAGGIAHEFNNALQGVTGNCELLHMTIPGDPETGRYIEAINESSERMAHLTRSLLAYARGGKYQAQNISFVRFVEESLPLITYDFGEHIELKTDLPPGLPHIMADTTQLQLVLSALLNNAAEAINGSGAIQIRARHTHMDHRAASRHEGMRPGDYVCLSVEDNGGGMPEGVLAHVFEPFFSTKSHGRGLGMAAVYGIIKNHEGWIGVDSEEGRGTRVSLYLPATVEAPEPKTAGKTPRPETGASILLIEDDVIVLDVCRAMLRSLGHEVIEAPTGRQALELARRKGGELDLALLDIKLPDMSGIELFDEIHEIHPSLPVIICSGYSIDGPAREILEAGARGFLQKPYSLNALQTALQDILEPGTG